MEQLEILNFNRAKGLKVVAKGPENYGTITFVLEGEDSELELMLYHYNDFMHKLLMLLIDKNVDFLVVYL